MTNLKLLCNWPCLIQIYQSICYQGWWGYLFMHKCLVTYVAIAIIIHTCIYKGMLVYLLGQLFCFALTCLYVHHPCVEMKFYCHGSYLIPIFLISDFKILGRMYKIWKQLMIPDLMPSMGTIVSAVTKARWANSF